MTGVWEDGAMGEKDEKIMSWNSVLTRFTFLLPERHWVVPTYLFLFIKEFKNIIISILKHLLCIAHFTTLELKNGSHWPWKSSFMTFK